MQRAADLQGQGEDNSPSPPCRRVKSTYVYHNDYLYRSLICKGWNLRCNLPPSLAFPPSMYIDSATTSPPQMSTSLFPPYTPATETGLRSPPSSITTAPASMYSRNCSGKIVLPSAPVCWSVTMLARTAAPKPPVNKMLAATTPTSWRCGQISPHLQKYIRRETHHVGDDGFAHSNFVVRACVDWPCNLISWSTQMRTFQVWIPLPLTVTQIKPGASTVDSPAGVLLFHSAILVISGSCKASPDEQICLRSGPPKLVQISRL